jgi:adenosylcobinamide kinase/adenosylcobinamide-phosphate guanylyltransferase
MHIGNGETAFILGAARSGKSAHAERLAIASGLQRHYVATALAGDDEMAARIAAHKARRGSGWTTHEVMIDLDAVLDLNANPGNVVLVDCLTLWLTNLMADGRDIDIETEAFLEALGHAGGAVILVANEVGAGIVPANELARRFRDLQGRLNQRVAAAADRVVLVAAGLPLTLKRDGKVLHG